MKSHRLLTFGFIGIILIAGVIGIWRTSNNNKAAREEPQNKELSSKNSAKTSHSFNKQLYSISDPSSLWVVVNKKRPLQPLNYVPSDLTAVSGGQMLRLAAAQAFSNLVAGAKVAGFNIVAESGYRSYGAQVTVYNNEVRSLGQAKADTESARPGYSEHQTGWAVDVASPGCVEDCFSKTAAASWVLQNASNYGFTLRYPPNKTNITGYRNEPWHFRFVGVDLAVELKNNAQTLEELFNLPAAAAY